MGKYICIGFSSLVFVQTVINIGMVLGFIPVIGITLPFFSSGGTSIMCLYFGVGLVQSVYIHREEREKLYLHIDKYSIKHETNSNGDLVIYLNNETITVPKKISQNSLKGSIGDLKGRDAQVHSNDINYDMIDGYWSGESYKKTGDDVNSGGKFNGAAIDDDAVKFLIDNLKSQLKTACSISFCSSCSTVNNIEYCSRCQAGYYLTNQYPSCFQCWTQANLNSIIYNHCYLDLLL